MLKNLIIFLQKKYNPLLSKVDNDLGWISFWYACIRRVALALPVVFQMFFFSKSKSGLNRYYKKLLFPVLILFLLSVQPVFVRGQNNNDKNTETASQGKNKKAFDEWKEIFKLRGTLNKNQYGSRYFMGLFDGRFIGPNDQDNYGIRTYSTAWDYLIFGNSLLSMLINMGFTADNINLISSGNVPNHHSFYLGCIGHYAISQEKSWVDSTFNRTVGKNVAVDKPFKASIPRLGIDSTAVKVDLGGFYIKRKVEKKTVYDTIAFPQIEGTGSWKDANNFDLVYEWMELFFNAYRDSLDISKRQFAKKTPKELQQCILQRFNTKKYLEANNLTEDELNYKIVDGYKNDIFDLVHQPNEKVFRMGQYEMFRYFNDVYWRDLNETVVMIGRGLNDAGELEPYSYVWKPSDKKNPVWHCAFQFDKDRETNPRSGLINYVMVPYGTKGRNMPTVVPNDLPPFSQFEGVVIWSDNCKKQSYSNKDDLWLNTLNGRMIDRNFKCYPYEVGILPLNDDGTVDGIYKIYVWKDDKDYWAYIFCGKHAGVRGGKPGKSFVDQVDNFRKDYNFSDYWYFYKDVDFEKDVVKNMPQFIGDLESLESRVTGIKGKTMPKVCIPIVTPNDKNPKKPRIDNFYVLLNADNTGTVFPDKINFFWKIDVYDDYANNMLVKKKSVIIKINKQEIPLDKFDDYLRTNNLSGSQVRKANDQFETDLKNSKKKDPVVNLNTLYNNHVYNLANSDETQNLINQVKEDLMAVRYELPKAERTLELAQDENADKLKDLKKQLDELELTKKTKKPIYAETKAQYDKLKEGVDKKLFSYNKLVAKETSLVDLLQLSQERLDINLNNDLANINSHIAFLESERAKYQTQLDQLKAEGKTETDNYRQVQTSIDNKRQELIEAENKRDKVQQEIENQKKLQSEKE
ncbi:MAG: hypothetical protein WCQ95_03360 [Bacteroidota bacterium]